MDTKVKLILDTRRDRAAETVTTQFPTWAAQLRCKVGGVITFPRQCAKPNLEKIL
jgi:hypothetical protein